MDKNNFKVGDKIKYIEATCSLANGNIYTVSDLYSPGDTPGVRLVESKDKDAWWYESRFKLEEAKIKYEIVKPFSIIDIYEKKPMFW